MCTATIHRKFDAPQPLRILVGWGRPRGSTIEKFDVLKPEIRSMRTDMLNSMGIANIYIYIYIYIDKFDVPWPGRIKVSIDKFDVLEPSVYIYIYLYISLVPYSTTCTQYISSTRYITIYTHIYRYIYGGLYRAQTFYTERVYQIYIYIYRPLFGATAAAHQTFRWPQGSTTEKCARKTSVFIYIYIQWVLYGTLYIYIHSIYVVHKNYNIYRYVYIYIHIYWLVYRLQVCYIV